MEIDKSKLCSNPDYAGLAMFYVFAGAVAQHAGKMPNPISACADGMFAVIKWWCANGPLCGGGKEELIDVAAEVATEVALQIYEQDVVKPALDSIKRKALELPCGGSHNLPRMTAGQHFRYMVRALGRSR